MTSHHTFESGDQLIHEGIHDSRLIAIETGPPGILLRFRCESPSPSTLNLLFPAQEQTIVWSAGIVWPVIVSAISLFPKVDADTRMDILPGDIRERLLKEIQQFSPGGWCMLIEALYGDSIAIFGMGDIRTAFQIELVKHDQSP
jgi:hypothetical protein